MACEDMPDRTARLERGIERIDRRAGNAEGAGDAFLFQNTDRGIDRAHRRHFTPRSLLFGVMIAGSTRDLNGNEFVSRDVEGTPKTAPDQAVGATAH